LVISIVVVLIAGLSVATYFILKPLFGEKDESNISPITKQLTEEEASKVIAEVNGEQILYKDFYLYTASRRHIMVLLLRMKIH